MQKSENWMCKNFSAPIHTQIAAPSRTHTKGLSKSHIIDGPPCTSVSTEMKRNSASVSNQASQGSDSAILSVEMVL